MGNKGLKQQKTCLHPSLISIIEEEETFSEDDDELEMYEDLEESD